MFRSRGLSIITELLPVLALFPFLIPHVEQSIFAPAIIFIAIILSDNGHIFVTSFRIFAKHRPRAEKIKHSLMIGGFILLALLWLNSGIPYFWSFFIYFTAFHHFRQNVGMFSWLAKAEKYNTKYLRSLAYTFFLVPFIFCHLRTDVSLETVIGGLLPIPAEIKSFLADTQVLFSAKIILNIFIFSLAALYSLREFLQTKKIRVGRYIFAVASLNSISMIWGQNFFELYIPLVIAHGMTYFIAVSESMVKIGGWSIKRAITIIFGAALLYGVIDWVIQADNIFDYQSHPLSFWVLIGAAVTAGLNMSHYFIDGFIWKKGDVDYDLLYSSKSPQ